ncbi:ATP synthase F1 subunit delta [Pirellulaceae bacterium SH449]
MTEQVSQVATVFDSEEQHVGQIYAKALLQAAMSSKKVDVVVEELESFVDDVLSKNASIDFFLSNPKQSAESKIGLLDRVFAGKMESTLLNFLKVLCRRQRIQFVRGVSRAAVELRDEIAGRVKVLVTTSEPLDPSTESALATKLKQTLNKDVRIVKKVDPTIIGGLIVRVGDTVFDGSVDGQLRVLRRELTAKADASIRGLTNQLISQ